MNWLIGLCFQVLGMEGPALTATVFLGLILILFMLAPIRKRISYLFMLVILFRLLIPADLFSRFSAFNLPVVQAFSQKYTLPADGGYVGNPDIAIEGTKEYQQAVQSGLQPHYEGNFSYVSYRKEAGQYRAPLTFREAYGPVLAGIWAGGAALIWGYGLISAVLLRRRVATATILEEGVYESDRIQAPFILGFFRPVIYLPLGLRQEQRRLILCHEQMHLKWKDPQIKVIAFFAMGLHWINPLVWLWFYRLFLSIIEEACDQDVLTLLGESEKVTYSQTLFLFASQRQAGGAVTVAFGESNVKERIRAALKYRKPFRILTILAGILAAVMMFSFSTSGVRQDGILVNAAQSFNDTNNGLLQLELFNAPNVRGVTLDLEIWSSQGMVQGTRIFSHRLSHWWSTLEKAPDWFNLSYSISRKEHMPEIINWVVQSGGETSLGSVCLPGEYPYYALDPFERDVRPQHLFIKNRLFFLLARFSQMPLDQQTPKTREWQYRCQTAYSSAEDIPIPQGQLILVARLQANASPESSP